MMVSPRMSAETRRVHPSNIEFKEPCAVILPRKTTCVNALAYCPLLFHGARVALLGLNARIVPETLLEG